jgi:hypothetical protein
MFYGIATFAQTKVLTTDGKMFMASTVETTDDAVNITVANEKQTIPKLNVLVIVPNGKPGYTYRVKNGKKLAIKKKFIHNDYSGTDKPRIFAYKYFGSPSNVSQLYVLNSDSSMTEEQFASIFNAQQKQLKTNNIVSLSLAIFAFILGAASLSNTANSLSYNSLDFIESTLPYLESTSLIFYV